jgi:LPS-assembly lipoprotein
MWWLEPDAKVRQLAHIALTLAMAGLVAGCFQPLYASRTVSGGPGIAEQLKSVEVTQVTAQVGIPQERIAAELRNMLMFDLGSGTARGAPTHQLRVQISSLQQSVIIDITTSRPDVEQAGIDAEYSLTEIATGKVVVRSRTFSRVSYDVPGQEQRFARARGRRDAEDRAAKVISEDIRSRLASYFLAGT